MTPVDSPDVRAEPVLERLTKNKRNKSWETQVIVFVNSTDRLYVESKTRLDFSSHKPDHIMTLTPFGKEQDIYRQSDNPDDLEYLATVNLEKLGVGCRFKRLVGKLSSLYVFDNPPEVDEPRRIRPRPT